MPPLPVPSLPMPPLAHAPPRPCPPSPMPALADAPFWPCRPSPRCLAAGRLQQGKQLWEELKSQQAGIWGAHNTAADGAADGAADADGGSGAAGSDSAGATAGWWQESPLLRFTDLLLTA
ncbi:unnamed protein product [Closterium sp. NIES-54]